MKYLMEFLRCLKEQDVSLTMFNKHYIVRRLFSKFNASVQFSISHVGTVYLTFCLKSVHYSKQIVEML